MSGESYGVVEVLDIIFVLIIATSTIAVIFLWAGPQMENKKASVRGDSVLTQFKTIGDIIKDVADQGVNGSCIVDFVTDTGQVFIGEHINERFILYYSLADDFDFNVFGLEDPDNIFTINPAGLFASADIFYLNNGESALGRSFNTIDDHDDCDALYPLVDAIKINLKDGPGNVRGRIWLFDLGSITYEMSSYRIITENGGTIWTDSQSGYLSNEPIIYNKDNSLVMKIIQLKPEGGISGGDLNKYSFLIKSRNISIFETKVDIPGPGYFKMQIYGDDKGAVYAWTNYFNKTLNFKKFTNDPGTPFDESKILGLQIEEDNDLFFSLVRSTCNVTAEMK
jgi:hypothetical protein